MSSEKDPSKVKGGHARALALTDERKAEIAQRAAATRWLRATHKGNFREEFGIDVDCYVLNDERKTAVISQRGMGAALGMGVGGSRLPTLVNNSRMKPFIGQELRVKLEKPLVFRAPATGGSSPPPSMVNGYDVTILVDICKAVVAAETAGTKLNPAVVRQAHIILSASAKAGIQGLVYALAGYDATRQEVIEAFKLYVQEEAREYEKEFPDQLYQEWYRLYELPKPEKNRPWKFMHLTVGQVYRPLARSSGKLLQLTRENRASSNEHHKRLHQFLSEIGVKALRQHLGQLLGIARISNSKAEYEEYVARLFGEDQQRPPHQGQLPLLDRNGEKKRTSDADGRNV
jgi:hypothetical protein